MKFLKILFIAVVLIFGFTYCASNNKKQMDFPQEIVQVFYEDAVDENQQQTNGINFFVEFEEELSEDLQLKKVYFRNQESPVEIVSGKKYIARFSEKAVIEDLILDSDSTKEYGNKPPIIVKPKFELKQNEAVLEYQKNNETFFYILTEVKEK